jgi:hypothetical protein
LPSKKGNNLPVRKEKRKEKREKEKAKRKKNAAASLLFCASKSKK